MNMVGPFSSDAIIGPSSAATSRGIMIATLLLSVGILWTEHVSEAFTSTPTSYRRTTCQASTTFLQQAKPAGTFFNAVPENDDDDDDDDDDEAKMNETPFESTPPAVSSSPKQPSSHQQETVDEIHESLEKLLKERNAPSLASQPSTINGIPTAQAGMGFGLSKSSQKKTKTSNKPYIGIGEPDEPPPSPNVNDVTKPEYDDQGYTLYTNEETGEKDRVFEALVEYPCDFSLKIVGANEGTFVADILQVVAEACQQTTSSSDMSPADVIPHKTRINGKWISVTVEAPVQNAEMLYTLYENIDKDPRVKFKF